MTGEGDRLGCAGAGVWSRYRALSGGRSLHRLVVSRASTTSSLDNEISPPYLTRTSVSSLRGALRVSGAAAGHRLPAHHLYVLPLADRALGSRDHEAGVLEASEARRRVAMST